MKNKYLERICCIFINMFFVAQIGLTFSSMYKGELLLYLNNFWSVNKSIFSYFISCFLIGLAVDILSGGFKKNTINYTKQRLMDKSKKHLLELGYQQEDLKFSQEERFSKKKGNQCIL
ncbi:hypothetical protein [Pasteurella testudinis]|uniref:hypothetical protein n=1 Tax=Pasteurella testudinis TaxID=761 RepID=UPI004058CBD3